jgi:MFS family permease
MESSNSVPTAFPDERAFHAEIERHYRWNFVVNALDITCFWFGLSFVSASTILPLYVSHLTDSSLLIGLVATIAQSGWFLPQLFTVHYVERLPRKKPVVVNLGFFSERVPLMVMAASAFLFAGRNPPLALALFFLAFVWHTVGAGLVAIAWQDMIAKIIPLDRRGRFFGIASFGGAGLGILGAALAALLLDHFDFPRNFALCFLLGFASILASWGFLSLTREPPLPSNKEPTSPGEYWRHLPSILRADRNFRGFLLNRILTGLGRMGLGFVAVYAVGRWHLPDSQASIYTALTLVTQTILNLLFGFMADRYGHKVVLQLGTAAGALAMLTAWVAPSPSWFYLAFVGLGATSTAEALSGILIVFEFTPPDDRPTYIGLVNTTLGIFGGLSPLIGGWIASRMGYAPLFATAFALIIVALVVLRWAVREPRWAGQVAWGETAGSDPTGGLTAPEGRDETEASA